MTRLARRVGHAEPHPGPSSGERPILCEYHGSQDGLDHYTAIRIHGARVLGFQWGNIAVLCRRHSSIDRLVKVLTMHGIPHTVQGEDRGPVPREDGNGITVSTFHASQGRQWPVVWVADVADRMVPGPTGLGDRFWVEEEKRLFYVAVTRATKRLYLSYCSAGEATATRFFALVRDVMSTEVVEPMWFYPLSRQAGAPKCQSSTHAPAVFPPQRLRSQDPGFPGAVKPRLPVRSTK